jgi:hypothetical protein
MAKFKALTTIGHSHKEPMIPKHAVFEPTALGLSNDLVKQMRAAKLIVPADGEPITHGPAPADAGKPEVPNVADTLKLIAEAQTIEDLDKLADGETRKGVLPALEARRSELTKK